MLDSGNGVQSSGAGEKSPAWYTAFYHLAQQVRRATHSALNHKSLYELVGLKERYINHSNPTVRKRTAGTLSRIIHTGRYAQDMREALRHDPAVFDRAADTVCTAVRDAQRCDDAGVRAWIVDDCWPDVRRGLVNESDAWRVDLDLLRLDLEMACLFGCGDGVDACALLAAILHVMAFGHLEVEKARKLVDGASVDSYVAAAVDDTSSTRDQAHACVMRFTDSSRAVLSGFWNVSESVPFAIGRYTDCQAIELSGQVSRIHCLIRWDGDAWFVEDAGSRNGIEVFRGGVRVCEVHGGVSSLETHGDACDLESRGSACVDETGGSKLSAPESRADDSPVPIRLEFGDTIVLPNGSTYLFSALDDRSQVAAMKPWLC